MNKHYIIAILVIMFTGCNFLDVAGPDTKVDATEVYKNNQMPMQVLAQIYGSMFNEESSPYMLAVLTGLSGDELYLASDLNTGEFYRNQISPFNLYLKNFWTACYANIRDANDVYENTRASTSIDSVFKKRFMAEALLIRAYWYFNLVNLFGDIPLPVSIDAHVNLALHRTSVDDVYVQIETDLKTAQQDLDDAYLNKDRTAPVSERILPNKATATALLARLYLYWQKYDLAEQEASAVISMNDMYALEPLKNVFLSVSKEAIWQLAPDFPNNQNINTSEGSGFILEESPDDFGQHAISQFLLNAFENGDQRRLQWIKMYNTYAYPYKYKIKSGNQGAEHSTLLRLAEQYLIRAEAKIYLGEPQEALSDLNVIRKRAGLPLLSLGNMNQAALLKAVLHERQVELFTEQGHRWFDLKRTGNATAVMSIVNVAKSGAWSSASILWPIPGDEISKDSNLVQNHGY
jgi:starch-binding outer membrane protein, SusD/RagB family